MDDAMMLIQTETGVLFALGFIFLLAGLVKGMIGIGMPAICMVLMTLFLPPLVAIPLTATPTMIVNMLQLYRAKDRGVIVRRYGLFAGSLSASIFIIGYFVRSFPEALLLLVLGIAMVIFSVQSLAGFSVRVSSWQGWQVLGGVASGFVGGLSSVFSPPIVMYLLGRNVEKDEFIGATGFLFLAGCLPLVGALILNGVLTMDILIKSLAGLVIALIGFVIGERIRAYISQPWFRRLILIFFLIMGCRLILISIL
jgi:uncharacterized membrane protein YfcA